MCVKEREGKREREERKEGRSVCERESACVCVCERERERTTSLPPHRVRRGSPARRVRPAERPRPIVAFPSLRALRGRTRWDRMPVVCGWGVE